jgi:hypothetical protein
VDSKRAKESKLVSLYRDLLCRIAEALKQAAPPAGEFFCLSIKCEVWNRLYQLKSMIKKKKKKNLTPKCMTLLKNL